LWKKLGWTIEQTDKAIMALYPTDKLPTGVSDAADRQNLAAGFRTLLPRLGVVLQVMDRLQLTPARDLASVLACWSPIDTYRPGSLYRKMFLTRTLLKQDSPFTDDGYGNVLQDATQQLLAHADTVRSAFNLTADELAAIVADLGFDAASPPTPLTLDNISAI